jgi:hypothetical protein
MTSHVTKDRPPGVKLLQERDCAIQQQEAVFVSMTPDGTVLSSQGDQEHNEIYINRVCLPLLIAKLQAAFSAPLDGKVER